MGLLWDWGIRIKCCLHRHVWSDVNELLRMALLQRFTGNGVTTHELAMKRQPREKNMCKHHDKYLK